MEEKQLVCPHCKSELGPLLDFIEVGDMEGEYRMDCDFCEREFSVKFKFILSTTIEKID